MYMYTYDNILINEIGPLGEQEVVIPPRFPCGLYKLLVVTFKSPNELGALGLKLHVNMFVKFKDDPKLTLPQIFLVDSNLAMFRKS